MPSRVRVGASIRASAAPAKARRGSESAASTRQLGPEWATRKLDIRNRKKFRRKLWAAVRKDQNGNRLLSIENMFALGSPEWQFVGRCSSGRYWSPDAPGCCRQEGFCCWRCSCWLGLIEKG